MKEGWKSIQESENMENKKPSSTSNLAELKVQKSVLDKVHTTLILTIWQLVKNYFLLLDHKKAIVHLKSIGVTGLNAFFGYSTADEVVNNGKTLSKCFSLKLGGL